MITRLKHIPNEVKFDSDHGFNFGKFGVYKFLKDKINILIDNQNQIVERLETRNDRCSTRIILSKEEEE